MEAEETQEKRAMTGGGGGGGEGRGKRGSSISTVEETAASPATSKKMKRKKEMKALRTENERLKSRVAHLEERVGQLKQQLRFYESITAAHSPDNNATRPPSSSSTPSTSFADDTSWNSSSSSKASTPKEVTLLKRKSSGGVARRNTLGSSSPTPTTTSSAEGGDQQEKKSSSGGGKAKPVVPLLRNMSADSGDAHPLVSRSSTVVSPSGSARRMSMTDGRSLTGSSWLSGSGSGDSLEAIMSASGELTMRRKTVGCDDNSSSLSGSGSVILDHNNNNNNNHNHNKAGSNPGSPLQERHNNNSKEVVGSPSARDQAQRLRQERREKVEAEFRAVQAAWAGEAEGVQSEDEVVEPHPFDEPDLPTNIIFKDTSQAKAHRRPTLTDNSQPAEATLASDAFPTTAAASMSSIAAVAEVTPMPSSAAQAQSQSPVLSPRREGVVTVTEETAVAQSTAPKADALRIRAGTLHKLIERLLGDYVDLDPPFLGAFLLTYRSFTTPDELLDLLIQRWNISPSPPTHKEATKLQFRIWLVLKTWVCDYFAQDFEENPQLTNRLHKFVFLRVSKSLPSPATKLIAQLQRLVAGDEVKMEVIVDDMPKPILPRSRSFRRLSFSLSQRARIDLAPLSRFMDFHPLELARQLTLVESSFFREIQPKECLKLCWSVDKANAPNILALINHFNALSGYIKVEILKTVDCKQRAKVLEYFLQVGKCCQELSNFNALMEITSSLNAAAVHRLKNTWKLVNSKYAGWKEEWGKLTLNNYVRLREAQMQAEPPYLPYVGIILSDLTFIEEGNKDFVMVGSEHSLINFEKRRKVATVLTRLQQCQRTPFGFRVVPQIYGALQQEIVFDPEEMDDNHLYQLSLQREPRNDNKPAAKE